MGPWPRCWHSGRASATSTCWRTSPRSAAASCRSCRRACCRSCRATCRSSPGSRSRRSRRARRRTRAGSSGTTALFVAGFGTVFVLLGLDRVEHRPTAARPPAILTRISGTIMLAMALFLLGSMFLRAPWLYQEKRFHPDARALRRGRAARRRRRVRVRLVAVPRPDPRIDPRHRRRPAPRVGGRHVARRVFDRARACRSCSPASRCTGVTGALGWVKRHFPLIVVGSAVVLGGFGLLLMFDRAQPADRSTSSTCSTTRTWNGW